MAKVTGQNIPTDYTEEELDPPIDFIETYRRLLTEDISWPKLPAGQGIVTYTKHDSRPAQRNSSDPGASPIQREWRNEFDLCSRCWMRQPNYTSQITRCKSAGSRHYVADWKYVPGAQRTFYNQFMKECLDWRMLNPGRTPPLCEDLGVVPWSHDLCPGDSLIIHVMNGVSPFSVTADCGDIDILDYPGAQVTFVINYTAPDDPAGCPVPIIISFTDGEGRKGCCLITILSDEECCCMHSTGPVLGAESLIMGCDQIQTIDIDPESQGCPPYLWSLSGGGTLTPDPDDPDRATAEYHSPLTNPDCANNPTITVTDACGDTAELKIAVSCGGAGDAYAICNMTVAGCSCYAWYDPPNQDICHIWQGTYTIHRYTWDCHGVLTQDEQSTAYDWCYNEVGRPCPCFGGGCIPRTGACCYGLWPDTMTDLRTPTQKAAGCCPLNPATGLPF